MMKKTKPPRKKHPDQIDRQRLSSFTLRNDESKEFARGVELFNRGEFWLAHEAWEEIWIRNREDCRLFFQGLIQAAAAYHLLVEKGSGRGGRANLEKALPKLKPFEPAFLGIRVTPLVEVMESCLGELRESELRKSADLDRRFIPRIAWVPN